MLPAFVLILLFIILLFPQFWVQKVIKKYSEPIKTLPGTGGELAQHLVKRFKLDGVSIKKVENGNDHYNPETKTIALSESNYNENVVQKKLKIHILGTSHTMDTWIDLPDDEYRISEFLSISS